MRRILGAMLVLCLGGVLAGCGSSGLSYDDGYATGRTMAATASDARIGAKGIVGLCARQWRVSASTLDTRGSWLRGCVAGFEVVERSLFG